MNRYVMIFRTTRTFTDEEQLTRLPAIHQWVAQATSTGVELDPRNLGETVAVFAEGDKVASGTVEPVDGNLVTMVFFDASDPTKALDIARMHPGPRYGVTLELREWNAPAVVVTQS